jgi:hypothetical protein
MTDESLLTPSQRRELIAFAAPAADAAMDDAELIGAAAERIGMTGDMAIDDAGVLELERDGVLVVLEAVPDEDAELVEHPGMLHLGVYVQAGEPARRAELEEAGIIDPPEPGEEADGTPEEDGWAFAWWGANTTRLPREAPLPVQMQAMHDVMTEAVAVLERGSVGPFFDRLGDLLLDEE